MPNIDFLTDEEIQFLQVLAHKLKTQDTACTRKPVYFNIQESETIFGIDREYAEECLLIGDEYDDVYTLEEAVEHLKKYCGFTDSELDEFYDLEDVQEFLDKYKINNILTGYKKEPKYSGVFLTRDAANKHIETNGHNLKEPLVYCQHAFRNPELEKLLEIIEKFDR